MLFFLDCFGYLESFKVSSKYCDYIFFKCHFILIEIATKLQMALGNMGILPRLVLLIHERGLFPFICVIPNSSNSSKFYSSNSYNFEYTYILSPWLSLFLSILLFWYYCELMDICVIVWMGNNQAMYAVKYVVNIVYCLTIQYGSFLPINILSYFWVKITLNLTLQRAIMNLILKVRQLRLWMGKWLAQGHVATKWWRDLHS